MSIKLMMFIFGLGCAFSTLSDSLELEVVTENWKPYNYSEDGKIRGNSTEILVKVLERANIKYNIKVYPWPRAYSIAQTKQNILIYTIMRTPSREHLFKWIRPLGKKEHTFLYRLKENEKIGTMTVAEAKNHTIGTTNESMDHTWLKKHGFSLLDTPTLSEQAIKMFFSRRFDLLAFNSGVMKEEFNNIGFDTRNAVPVIKLFETVPYMALSLSTSNDVLNKLQRSFDQLVQEGLIDVNYQ